MDKQTLFTGASDSPDYQNWLANPNPESNEPPADAFIDAVLYDRLRRLASRYLSQQARGHPLEASDLVNEMILRVANSKKPVRFRTPEHFVAVSAIVMRHILIDHARAANLFSRCSRMPLENHLHSEITPLSESVSMRQVLQRLAGSEGRLYRIVVMRVFEGCTFEEIAFRLSICTRTAKRGWICALKQLRGELEGKGKRDIRPTARRHSATHAQ